MAASTFPPRLHVLLARGARTAVVLRRGPSRVTAVIGWDRARDAFAVGQWLRGRIYERRCDLSRDGRYLIYFARDGRWASATGGSWTAVSRAPYLAAVALWGKGDAWHGGGLFVDGARPSAPPTYWLNDGHGHAPLGDLGEVRRAEPAPYVATSGECLGVYLHRLRRDGWEPRPELASGAAGAWTGVFEKPLAHGWRLRKLCHAMLGAPEGKGVYHDGHALVHASGREVDLPAWEWADLDGARLVWAEAGALWTGAPGASSGGDDAPLGGVRRLHDFTGMAFEARAAPYAGVDTAARSPRGAPRIVPRRRSARR